MFTYYKKTPFTFYDHTIFGNVFHNSYDNMIQFKINYTLNIRSLLVLRSKNLVYSMYFSDMKNIYIFIDPVQ